jgi:Fur family ferric uptake transcriptional regulator
MKTTSAQTDKVREAIVEKAVAVFVDYLEPQQLRKTPERFAVLREVYAMDDHFDMDALYLHMKQKKHQISRATLYNTIEHLLACDLVTRHQFGKSNAVYERSLSYKQHDHLICQDCGKILEFCDPRVQQIQSMMGDILGFDVNSHSLNLFGKCRQLRESRSCPHFTPENPVPLT